MTYNVHSPAALEIAARIRAKMRFDPGVRVDMSEDFVNQKGCQTVGCLLGWTRYFMVEDRTFHLNGCDCLGLSEDEANRLFMPPGWNLGLEVYSEEHAIRTLEHYGRTGVVDWEATRP